MDVRRSHEELSPQALRFLDFADRNPDTTDAIDLRKPGLSAWIDRFDATIQPWPTLVGGPKLAEIESATLEIVRLLRRLPRLAFDDDPERLAGYYGIDDPLLASLLLEPPNGLDACLARCDFVNTEDGLRCLEVNLGTFMGGWQLRFWQHRCLANPPTARFLDEERLEARYHDPLETLFRHIATRAADTRGTRRSSGGPYRLVLVLDDEELAGDGEAQAFLEDLFAETCSRVHPNLEGCVTLTADSGGFSVENDGALALAGRSVDAVVEYTRATTPRTVFRSFKAGEVDLYSGPLAGLLGNKRSLTLLSELAERDRLPARDCEVVRRYVPWTREAAMRRVSYDDEDYELEELLREEPTRFVLKPAAGNGGEGVVVGRFTDPEAWDRAVRRALSQPGWVVQEYVRSRPYRYQWGERGTAVHDLVWGVFCFGELYGGGFLRLAPRDSADGVLNAKRGASEGLYFQVHECR